MPGKLRETGEMKLKIGKDPWFLIGISFLSRTFLIPSLKVLLRFIRIVTHPFHTVNAKNINQSNLVCQYINAIIIEMDLLLQFALRSFSCFKLLKEGPCYMKSVLHSIFFWLMAVRLLNWFLRIRQFLHWCRKFWSYTLCSVFLLSFVQDF